LYVGVVQLALCLVYTKCDAVGVWRSSFFPCCGATFLEVCSITLSMGAVRELR